MTTLTTRPIDNGDWDEPTWPSDWAIYYCVLICLFWEVAPDGFSEMNGLSKGKGGQGLDIEGEDFWVKL
jgi:hypothetical protein